MTFTGPLLASTIESDMNRGADNAPTQVDWAQLLTNGTIGGVAVFRQQIGASGSEAVAPLENRNAATYALWLDNTGGSTGVALANLSQQAVNITVALRDDTGTVSASNTMPLPARGHTSFNLADRFPAAAQRRETIEFTTPAGGQISVLGLRFDRLGGFSTVPPLAK